MTALAKLPPNYERAMVALERCVAVDECKEWADKAAALASYARQADEDDLYKNAMRIKGRAIRRMGELAKALESAQGKRSDLELRAGKSPKLSERDAVTKAAGLTPKQVKTAMQVASIPKREFERLIEADAPPTVTELAKLGTKPVQRSASHLNGRDAAEFSDAIKVRGRLRDLATICESVAPTSAVRGSADYDHPKMRGWSKTIGAWLERLDSALEKAKDK